MATEVTTNLVFPNTPELQNSIPLWARFRCNVFPQSSLYRGLALDAAAPGAARIGDPNYDYAEEYAITSVTPLLANIVVPAQIATHTNTQLPYKNARTSAIAFLPEILRRTEIGRRIGDIDQEISDIMRGVSNTLNRIGLNGALSPGQHSLDNDLVFNGAGSYKSHHMTLILPCFFGNDSIAASNIARAFEAYYLPSGVGGGNVSRTLFFHPPVWSYGITNDLRSQVNNQAWSGSPQPSVLMTVKTKRIPLESSSIVGIDSDIKPMLYNISLVFNEFEPTFRIFGTTITNRSGILSNLGQAASLQVDTL